LIYGGYYIGFGAIWNRADFEDHDWWCSKLAAMFTTGSQMGWFSLAGMENDSEDDCGPMGVGDLFMKSSNDDLVSFMNQLSTARTAANDFFVNGHVARPPQLHPFPAVKVFTSSFDKSQRDYDTVVVQAWTLESKQSSLVVLVGCATTEYVGEMTVNVRDLLSPAVFAAAAAAADSTARIVMWMVIVNASDSTSRSVVSKQQLSQVLDLRNPSALQFVIPVRVPARSVVVYEISV
jgi:hypothetical protein